MPAACDAPFDAQVVATARCENTTLAADVAQTMRARFEGSCVKLHELPCGNDAVGTCDYLASCVDGSCVRQGAETCR